MDAQPASRPAVGVDARQVTFPTELACVLIEGGKKSGTLKNQMPAKHLSGNGLGVETMTRLMIDKSVVVIFSVRGLAAVPEQSERGSNQFVT